jgi:hypothetical protein
VKHIIVNDGDGAGGPSAVDWALVTERRMRVLADLGLMEQVLGTRHHRCRA